MCRKMKSMRVFLNLLHYFYRRIQCDKIYNYVHGEAFEVKHEMPILGVELKRHTESTRNVQLPSKFLSMSPKLFLLR